MREEASSCSQRTQTVHTFTLTPSFSGRRPEPIAVEFVLCTLSGGCIHTYHSGGWWGFLSILVGFPIKTYYGVSWSYPDVSWRIPLNTRIFRVSYCITIQLARIRRYVLYLHRIMHVS